MVPTTKHSSSADLRERCPNQVQSDLTNGYAQFMYDPDGVCKNFPKESRDLSIVIFHENHHQRLWCDVILNVAANTALQCVLHS